jgi:hypothetical protein
MGFVRIFISDTYVDLSRIAQESPIKAYEEWFKRKPGDKASSRGTSDYNAYQTLNYDTELGFWGVITLPLVQRA